MPTVTGELEVRFIDLPIRESTLICIQLICRAHPIYSIFRLYRPMQSVDRSIHFLVLSSDSCINRWYRSTCRSDFLIDLILAALSILKFDSAECNNWFWAMIYRCIAIFFKHCVYELWSHSADTDTDPIFRLYRLIQSVNLIFRFLYRAIVSALLKFRLFNQPFLCLALCSSEFSYRPIESVNLEPILSVRKK